MRNAVYPIMTSAANRRRPYEVVMTRKASFAEKINILYIGDQPDLIDLIDNRVDIQYKAKSYLHAQTILTGLDVENLPGCIVIDLVFRKNEHQNFCRFLNRIARTSEFVLIYNSNKLDEGKSRFLKSNNLVDDIVDLRSSGVNYFSKVSFLRQARQARAAASGQKGRALTHSFTKGMKYVLKRGFDITLASLAIILFSPLFIIIPILIRIGSKGPVIYKSARAGRGFRVFNFYKFRTMVADADKKIDSLRHLNQYNCDNNGALFLKLSNDPRVTKIGKILRNTSLDELPQLFNVLKGDMSLVGNRPLPLYEAASLTTNDTVERFMAPAGITGLWQVKKRGRSEMSVEERIMLDISYARNANLFYDLWIIAQTPNALFQKTNV
ncbi:MAG TPA: sugar transferase [Chitinophagaceae bacterium]|nr:sugar transferase [Chitinophagaceae bacterium]